MLLKKGALYIHAVRKFTTATTFSLNIHPPTSKIPQASLQVIEDVISEEQERVLIGCIDTLLKRKRYEKNHFDDVILNYREIEIYPEKLKPFPEAAGCLGDLERTIRRHYGGEDMKLIPPHVIDLHATGLIAPHIDSVKFSGDMIAALSLGSARIARLQLDDEFSHLYLANGDSNAPEKIEFVVRPRSLYILSGPMRYHYTHEILGTSQTSLTDACIDIGRRLSIMIRDEKEK